MNESPPLARVCCKYESAEYSGKEVRRETREEKCARGFYRRRTRTRADWTLTLLICREEMETNSQSSPALQRENAVTENRRKFLVPLHLNH